MSLPARPQLSPDTEQYLAKRHAEQPGNAAGPPPADEIPPPPEPPDDEEPPVAQPDAGRSWRPIDLGPYLRGEVKPAEPTVGLVRVDGLRLIYPGKEHSIIGEMESGKSWVCLASVAAELAANRYVLYVHFEESDPTDTVDRLRALNVPDETILARFRFVGPEVPATSAWLAELLAPAPSLVVLDGVNEAMSLHGQAIREEDGAAAFRRRLVKPCTAAGAAVLSADHVGKDTEKRSMGALGSIHKGNGLTGALISLENVEPFGRGRRGRSRVYVLKDRPGHLRRNGRATKTPRKTYMGELVVDDVRDEFKQHLELVFFAPPDAEPEVAETDAHAETDEYVLSVVANLVTAGVTPTGRKVRVKSKFGTDKTLDSLERLTIDGKLIKKPGPGGSHEYMPADAGSPGR